MEPLVQKELGLSDKQRGRLAQWENEAQARRQGFVSNPPGQAGFDFNTMMNQVEQSTRQHQAAISKLLTPAQKTRLLQIEWQREGWVALNRPDLAEPLKLSPTQNRKIQAIVGSMRQAHLQAMMNPMNQAPAAPGSPKGRNLNPANGFIDPTGTSLAGGGPLGFNTDDFQKGATASLESAAKVQAASAQEVDELLTPEQRSELETLLGPPFDFKAMNGPDPATDRRKAPPRSRPPLPKPAATKP